MVGTTTDFTVVVVASTAGDVVVVPSTEADGAAEATGAEVAFGAMVVTFGTVGLLGVFDPVPVAFPPPEPATVVDGMDDADTGASVSSVAVSLGADESMTSTGAPSPGSFPPPPTTIPPTTRASAAAHAPTIAGVLRFLLSAGPRASLTFAREDLSSDVSDCCTIGAGSTPVDTADPVCGTGSGRLVD